MMDKSGVDIFRINMSHTSVDEFEKLYYKISKWTDKPVCLDKEGSQLRTSELYHKKYSIKVKAGNLKEFVGRIFR